MLAATVSEEGKEHKGIKVCVVGSENIEGCGAGLGASGWGD